MLNKRFIPSSSQSYFVAILLCLSLSHCASEQKIDLPPKSQKPLKLNVVNNTKDFVESIQIKPCGTPSQYYTTLANDLKPSERMTLTLYDVCVDAIAVDGFRTTLYEKNNMQMTKSSTWQLK